MSETKMGRPPLPKSRRKSELLRMYLTPAEITDIRKTARSAGLAPSDWAREALLTLARGEGSDA